MSEVAFPPKHVSAAKAVFTGRCPVCREGAVFKEPGIGWIYRQQPALSGLQHRFRTRTGLFLDGSMYVSYSFNVATLVAVYLFLWVLFDPESPWVYIAAVIGVTVAIVPFTARLFQNALDELVLAVSNMIPTAARRMP